MSAIHSDLNPPAFSPAAFVNIFTQNPKMELVPTYYPEGAERWFHDYLSTPSPMIKDMRLLGSVDSLMTPSIEEAQAWYAKYSMVPPTLQGPGSLYVGSVFDFMMNWTKEPHKYQREDMTYLNFGGRELEFKSSFQDRGGYLPAPEGAYAWVCMPEEPINDASELMNFVNGVEHAESNPELMRSRETYKYYLHVPAFAVRSDRSNDPAINGTQGLLREMSHLFKSDEDVEMAIVDTNYSNRVVFNDKGAYMRSAMTMCAVPTCIQMPTPTKEVVIDKPFVFVAGGRNSGPLLAIYVPKIYWEYIGGTDMEALAPLNSASWKSYVPKSLASDGVLTIRPPPAILTPAIQPIASADSTMIQVFDPKTGTMKYIERTEMWTPQPFTF
jgi:hypothetical protein